VTHTRSGHSGGDKNSNALAKNRTPATLLSHHGSHILCSIQRVPSSGPLETRLFGKNTETIKREELLQIMFPVLSVGHFTYDETLRRYALYIINGKFKGDVATLTWQWKGTCSIEGGSGNEGARTTGDSPPLHFSVFC
jgi:hypothetical protein